MYTSYNPTARAHLSWNHNKNTYNPRGPVYWRTQEIREYITETRIAAVTHHPEAIEAQNQAGYPLHSVEGEFVGSRATYNIPVI